MHKRLDPANVLKSSCVYGVILSAIIPKVKGKNLVSEARLKSRVLHNQTKYITDLQEQERACSLGILAAKLKM